MICPLLMTANKKNENNICRGSDCAWWIQGGCAIEVIAQGIITEKSVARKENLNEQIHYGTFTPVRNTVAKR